MQELFKALSILQTNQTVKKHFVHIQDKEVEVTLDEKKRSYVTAKTTMYSREENLSKLKSR